MRILFVGDDVQGRPILRPALRGRGHRTALAATLPRLEDSLRQAAWDVLVLDWELSGALGESAWRLAQQYGCPTIVLTHDLDQRTRFTAGRQRACLIKPFPLHALEQALIDVAPSPAPQGARVDRAEADPSPSAPDSLLESRNAVMNRLLQLAWRAAETDATVLLLGESGTGKTALARAIHLRSTRHDRPFVTVHCPCLHPQLLESQLFGHARGAFTGAVHDSVGRAAAADGGTLFLDEVGDLPLDLQPKLLRLLQDREFEPVGDTQTRRVDIRVIAATHRDLAAEVAASRFREDLYYRLNVVALRVVPLRRRPEDVLPCARAFLAEAGHRSRRAPRDFAPLAQAMLQGHAWPGNLRELRNTIERAAILARGAVIERTDLLLDPGPLSPPLPHVGELVSLAEIEQAHIREVVSRVGNYRQAARILGIDKSTLYRKLRDRGDAEDDPLAACA